MLARIHDVGRGFIGDRAGVSAVEFAIIAPIMILLGLGGVDSAHYIEATQEINVAAKTIGQMLTENTTGDVNYVDLQFYHDSTVIAFPEVLADAAKKSIQWSNDISITMSSIKFTATPANCTSSCTYTPKVIWTAGNNPRTCGKPLLPVVDASVPSPTTLPTDVYGPGSLIVVDISYNFTPVFSSVLPSPISIARSIYLAPRYVPLINYQAISGDNGIATICS
jgi:Flp pilus assembly protein TadG